MQAVVDGDDARRAVRHEHGDEEGADAAGAVVLHGDNAILQRLHAADGGRDDNAHARTVEGIEVDTGLGDSLVGGGNRQLFVAIAAPGFFGVHILARVKILYLASDLYLPIGGIKQGDGTNARAAIDDVVPRFFYG